MRATYRSTPPRGSRHCWRSWCASMRARERILLPNVTHQHTARACTPERGITCRQYTLITRDPQTQRPRSRASAIPSPYPSQHPARDLDCSRSAPYNNCIGTMITVIQDCATCLFARPTRRSIGGRLGPAADSTRDRNTNATTLQEDHTGQ